MRDFTCLLSVIIKQIMQFIQCFWERMYLQKHIIRFKRAAIVYTLLFEFNFCFVKIH